ncbi:transcriptional corepressor LEUNIG_HOMOLOG-like isoform X2 [Tasmannia lanceolata]|uniref:transcriptional corepressor LEUNIG_HOMOLOG-like isoform X2 n=1 Tax=Tasmannia lanceolata TaxID=3420 RepID=UPI0040629C34
MAGNEFDAQKMLDRYIHDYLMKNKSHEMAEIFMEEVKLSPIPIAIDAPEGFLSEWWSIFYDMFNARVHKNFEAKEARIKAQSPRMDEQQPHPPVPPMQQRVINHSSPIGLPTRMYPEIMLGQPPASLLASRVYEERLNHPPPRERGPKRHLVDVANQNSCMQQQVCARRQQHGDNTHVINLERSLSAEPMLYGGPTVLLPRSGLSEAGLNKGVSPLPLNGWPLTGVNQICPSSGHQILEPLLHTSNKLQQFQLLTPQHQQEVLTPARARTSGNLISPLSAGCSVVDQRGLIFLRSGLNGNAGQQAVNIGSQQIVSSIQTASPLVRKESGQKRKHNDEISMPITLSQSYSVSDNLKGYGSEGIGGLAETSEQMDGLNDGSLDDNVESFLSHDNSCDAPFSELAQSSTDHCMQVPKGFSFTEVACLCSSTSKVVCCHFSSDGKMLASSGHDKKVAFWNMDTFDVQTTSGEHSLLITDVRFRPSSTLLATSSFDKTVRVWNANKPSKSLCKLIGHGEQVMSVDFHPTKVDILGSCDRNGEIRLWNVNKHACERISKGGSTQVRFQPRIGQLLASATENIINVLDVETDQIQLSLKGHIKEVHSICWDPDGQFMASVSEDCVRVWSVATDGKCIDTLRFNGNKFSSCTFHPGYPLLLVIGGYQVIEFWQPIESCKTMTYPAAHQGIVAALANSPSTGMMASASHDRSVKVWK